ncbi:MAG: TGS domain-containing protein [Candidatus Lokiarchaeota archaeon]|nr:TGS domain-containing protein [Candidatus Lokiarchaeota archaeon]
MSSNIGPLAQEAYQKYLDASSIDDKIKRLEEFISLVPKHKATEKIVALNKSRLAKLRREQEAEKIRIKTTGKKASPFSIKKEGIQLILISDYHSPGVGKTSLLNLLTGAARDKIGKFTPIPEIGIYEHEKVRYQIVDMPSIMQEASTGIGNGREIISQLRACDLICFCVDLSRDYKEQMNLLLTELHKSHVRINVPPPPVTIEKTGSNKIQVFYLTSEAKENNDIEELTERIKEIAHAGGIRNGIVKVYGKIELDHVVDSLNPSIVYKKSIILGTKGDLALTKNGYDELEKSYSNIFPLVIGTSVKMRKIPGDFGKIVLTYLQKMKVYTMNKGIVAEKPLLIDSSPNKPTIRDVAIKIHRSFFESFDHAIVIRKDARQEKKKVGLDYELKENDIIELHTK